MIDPHGSDIQEILATIPQERLEDVIYFDPSYTARPMGLNMLEYDVRFPEQKTFVVNEMFSIFQKLYGGVPESMGPIFEQYFRNATLLIMDSPESGSTLLEIPRVLASKSFREMKLARKPRRRSRHSAKKTRPRHWSHRLQRQTERPHLTQIPGLIKPFARGCGVWFMSMHSVWHATSAGPV